MKSSRLCNMEKILRFSTLRILYQSYPLFMKNCLWDSNIVLALPITVELKGCIILFYQVLYLVVFKVHRFDFKAFNFWSWMIEQLFVVHYLQDSLEKSREHYQICWRCTKHKIDARPNSVLGPFQKARPPKKPIRNKMLGPLPTVASRGAHERRIRSKQPV